MAYVFSNCGVFMRKFEYKISMHSWFYLQDILNEKGLDRWELVSADRTTSEVTCIFKREILDETVPTIKKYDTISQSVYDMMSQESKDKLIEHTVKVLRESQEKVDNV